MAEFQAILELVSGLQSIKSKYPMIVSHLKHLQKCNGNKQAEDKEVAAFKTWLLSNPELPTLTDPYYKSSKSTICFNNVKYGSVDVIARFEERLCALEKLMYPDGRPQPAAAAGADAPASDMTPGVAAAMATLEGNPVFSGLLANVKDVIADTDVVADPSSILENKNFKVLLKNIQKGLASGKYNLSDISTTIRTVVGAMKNDMDDDMSAVVAEALGMMSAVEQGQQPDVSRLFDMLKTVSLN